MIKAVLFDMDGVMFDTERLASQSMAEARKQMHLIFDDDVFQKMRGRNGKDCVRIMEESLPDKEVCERFFSTSSTIREDFIKKNGTPVKEGLEEMLAYLEKRKIRKAVVTSSKRDTVDFYFQHCKFPLHFDVMVCGMEIPRGKPFPDAYLIAAQKLAMRVNECIVLEDSLNGIKAANKAGCRVVMIPDMDPPTAEAKNACSRICTDLKETIAYIEENNE